MVPRNCALYAEAVEYSPVAESFHLKVSCVPFCSTVFRTRPQSCTNSTKCVMLKVVVFLISRIKLLFCKASATVRHFLLEALNKFGAMSLGRRPCSQPDCQNSISNGYSCAGSKEKLVRIITRDIRTNPCFLRGDPFMP